MSDYSEWFPAGIKPVRVGVYQTSRDVVVSGRNIKDLGHGYGYWNGKEWLSWKGWGNHMTIGAIYDAVWRGASSEEAAKRNPVP